MVVILGVLHFQLRWVEKELRTHETRLEQLQLDMNVATMWLELEAELLLYYAQPLPYTGGGIDPELLLRDPHGNGSLKRASTGQLTAPRSATGYPKETVKPCAVELLPVLVYSHVVPEIVGDVFGCEPFDGELTGFSICWVGRHSNRNPRDELDARCEDGGFTYYESRKIF